MLELLKYIDVIVDGMRTSVKLGLAAAGIALVSGLVLGAVFMLAACLAPSAVMRIFGDEEIVISEGVAYLQIAGFSYFAIVVISILTGILTISLQNCRHRLWLKNKSQLSLVLSALGALLFIVSKQPYAATFLFVLFIIKIILITKRQ